jgi:hypothetical protein
VSTVQVYAGSVQYLRYPVAVTDETGATVDPTGDTVRIAFQPARSTDPLDWQAAEWVTDATTTPDTYYVRALLGQTPFVLAAGVFDCFIKISDNPETPILSAGTLYVAAAV